MGLSESVRHLSESVIEGKGDLYYTFQSFLNANTKNLWADPLKVIIILVCKELFVSLSLLLDGISFNVCLILRYGPKKNKMAL